MKIKQLIEKLLTKIGNLGEQSNIATLYIIVAICIIVAVIAVLVVNLISGTIGIIEVGMYLFLTIILIVPATMAIGHAIALALATLAIILWIPVYIIEIIGKIYKYCRNDK